MKHVLLAISASLFMVTAGYCQTEPLQLTIQSDKQAYEAGEEINIELAIHNNTKKSVKIYSPEYPGVSEIFVKNSHGDMIKSQPLAKAERASFDAFVTIPSNETRTFTFKNLEWFGFGGLSGFDAKKEFFPGTYLIYMTIKNPPACVGAKYLETDLYGTLVSNTITIKVTK